jgi:hypothetical protein
MGQWRQLGEVLSKRGTSPPLGYVNVFSTEKPPPEPGSVMSLDGLEAVQTVRSQDGQFIHVAFWASKEHHAIGSGQLLGDPGGKQIFEGVAARLAIAKSPWFKKIRVSTWLLSFVAIIGALEALTNRYEKLFSAPNALVKLDQRRYDLVQGERLAAKVTVENLLGVADLRDVDVNANLGPNAAQGGVTVLDPSRPTIQATKERSFQLDSAPLAAGNYTLSVVVNMLAGYVRWWPGSFTQHAEVRVYPLVARGVVNVQQETPTSAELVALVPTGIALKDSALC